jgi:hypothetical protein
MRKELEKYGIQMPAFSKIGGILESEVCIVLLMKPCASIKVKFRP